MIIKEKQRRKRKVNNKIKNAYNNYSYKNKEPAFQINK